MTALQADFKSYYEALAEVRSVQSEIVKAIENLHSWTSPRSVERPWTFALDNCDLRPEPLGVALIIAPWNYPISLIVEPLIGAISAGCGAVIKPSEMATNVAKILEERIGSYLDPELYTVRSGGSKEANDLLEWPHWDLIFFTGSARVGKLVAEKAATNLIPTILELGGKCPVIVDQGNDLKIVGHRIAFGKWFNAGQTCIAPDYILTLPSLVDELCEALIMAIKEFWSEDPSKSPDYSRIVNQNHWDRLNSLLDDSNAKIIKVGSSNREARYFSPTLVINPSPQEKLMQEEVFGPILSIIPVTSISDAMEFIKPRPKPLALYLFTGDSQQGEKVIQNVSAGTVCVNDTVMQVFSALLPLGGVGASGHGKYRGRWSVEAFSHMKPVMWRPQGGEWINNRTRNPPLNDNKFKLLSWALFQEPKIKKHTL